MSSEGESQNKKLYEAKQESLKKLHEKDIQVLIREAKAYHKAAQALQQQGQKFATELIAFGDKTENEWGKGFTKIGEAYKDIYNSSGNLNKSLLEDFINALTNKANDDTKEFSGVENRMKNSCREYESSIQKLALIAQSNRKKDPSIMLKSMQDLTQAVAETDAKREEMLKDMRSEAENADKTNSTISELKSVWEPLDKAPTPEIHLSSWSTEEYVPPAAQKDTTTAQAKKEKKPKDGRFSKLSILPKKKDSPKTINISEQSPPTISPPTLASETTTTPSKPTKYKAVFDYAAGRDDELSIQTGEIITVLKKQEDDWWFGVVDGTGKQGMFPSTFVQEIIETSVVVEQTVPEVQPSPETASPASEEGTTVPVEKDTIVTTGSDWIEAVTDSGETYFYNPTTGESKWSLD